MKSQRNPQVRATGPLPRQQPEQPVRVPLPRDWTNTAAGPQPVFERLMLVLWADGSVTWERERI